MVFMENRTMLGVGDVICLGLNGITDDMCDMLVRVRLS